jgi:hypothetical protein
MDKLSPTQMFIGFIFLAASLFLALAILDFTIMNAAWSAYPDWLYRYWMALGVVVCVISGMAAWMAYSAGLPRKKAVVVFFSTILLFVGGLLDIFYFMLAMLKGETYSFDVWSAQYKWFGYWDWPRQIIWTAACIALIIFLWYKAK